MDQLNRFPTSQTTRIHPHETACHVTNMDENTFIQRDPVIIGIHISATRYVKAAH